jgi:hypothetical protein
MLGRIFKPKREEVAGGWRRLQMKRCIGKREVHTKFRPENLKKETTRKT